MRRILQLSLGLTLGLVIAEALFWFRDDGAFPHVNFYRADESLGVRLEPNATERLALGKNPRTTAHTNSLGFRGKEWPATTGDDFIVVGDSQVFGLGVEDDQTFSSLLGALNAGVPTYGPREYLATAAELLATRKAKHVVVVLNASNDFFELSRPNTTRHAVWDGWAVRKETAPGAGETTSFPGRRWLMSQSHAVYAFRRWRAGDLASDGFASEGQWNDLVDSMQSQKEKKRLAQDALLTARGELLQEPPEFPAWLQQGDDDVESLRAFRGKGPLVGVGLVEASTAHPGDIVSSGAFEMARRVTLTADLIQKASQQLEEARTQLGQARFEARMARTKAVLEWSAKRVAFEDKRREARARIQLIRWDLVPPMPAPPPMVLEVRDLLVQFEATHHVEVTLVVLPLDVQVSEDEWKKYGEKPRSMTNTLELHRVLVETVRAEGIRAIDLHDVLLAAEPGAFLDGDLHLSVKGHAAVATALREVLAAPVPKKVLPREMPSPADWDAAEFMGADGRPFECEVRKSGEWVRIWCRPDDGNVPRATRVLEGDALVSGPGQRVASALLRLGEGRVHRIEFDLTYLTYIVEVRGSPMVLSFETGTAIPAPKPEPRLARYGECAKELLGDELEVWGDTNLPCLEKYESDCAELLACAQGHPSVK